jgi:fermentation-respiration switch protein FrsA (DUF1100 family)
MKRVKGAQPARPLPVWWRVVRVLAVGYLVTLLMLLWLENSLIFFPAKYPAGWWHPPGVSFEEAEFQAADGTRLHGWYFEVGKPQAVILFCHGNGGNLTHRIDVIEELPRHVNASLLLFDYRGYGKSEGSPDEAGVLADARAARAWLAKRAGVKERDIVLWGESIGGAVAVDLAAKDGARALILEDAFTSLPDAAAYHYPLLPVRLLMKSQFNSLASIGKYHGPLLMAHGDADSIVPYSFGQQLFAAANEPKRFLTQHGADHNDPRDEAFWQALQQFLTSVDQSPGADSKSGSGA